MEMPPIRGDIERERESRCERGEMEWGTVPGWKAVSKIAVPAAGIVVVCSSSRHLRRQAQALAQNEFHVVFPLYWCGFGSDVLSTIRERSWHSTRIDHCSGVLGGIVTPAVLCFWA